MRSYWEKVPRRYSLEKLPVVRSLYGDIGSFALGVSVVVVGCALTAWKTGNGGLWLICAVITLLSVIRLASMFAFTHYDQRGPVSATFWERLYLVLGTAHVACVGLWSTGVFWLVNDAVSELLSISCCTGFLIGIQGRNYFSPRIIRLQLIAAAVPIQLAFLIKGTGIYAACAVFFALFLLSVLRTSSRMCQTFSEAVETANVNEEMAFKDMLTGLPNRAAMQKLLALEVDEGNRPFAVLFLDLDHFKRINDTFGHRIGDELLIQAADRFTKVLGSAGHLGRHAGDEFVIIQPDLQNTADAVGLASELIAACGRPYALGDTTVTVGCSVGIAICPDDGASGEELLQRADTALYFVKREGRGRLARYEAFMGQREADRVALETDLRQAIADDRFRMAFQPIVDASSLRIRSCEALIRWHHPQRGSVPPLQYLPLAEEAGLMNVITEITIRKACEAAAAWPEEISVAVNISPSQLQRADLVPFMLRTFEETGLTAERFEIELTENLFLYPEEDVLHRLEYLRGLGVEISIDDFGTGYSNLSYLTRLPVDKVKIDRSFLVGMAEDSRKLALFKGLVSFLSELGLAIVVEGVETHDQLQFLTEEAGVDELQGFVFGMPLPEVAVREFLAQFQGGFAASAGAGSGSTASALTRNCIKLS